MSATGSRPIWTPDGKRVTFQKDGDLYSVPADDSSAPQLLLAHDAPATSLFPLAWSRDGHFLAYSRPTPTTNRDVLILAGGGTPRPFLATPRDERAAMFSPDGQWMVYAALEPGGEEEVYVQPHTERGERIVLSRGGGIEPVWSPTGTEIFYRSADGRSVMAVDIQTQPAVRVGTPHRLFQGSFPTFAAEAEGFWSNYDVAPDGRRLLMVEANEEPDSVLNVVINWMDEPTIRRP